MQPRVGIVATIILAFSLGWLAGHRDASSPVPHADARSLAGATESSARIHPSAGSLQATAAMTPTATLTATVGPVNAAACLSGSVSIIIGAGDPPPPGKAVFTDPLSGVKVTVLSGQSDRGDPQFSPPTTGHVFAVIQVALTNTGPRTRGYNALDFTLLDPATGQTFPASAIDIKVSHLLATGHLAPHASARGALIFDVPLRRRFRLLWDDQATLSPPIAVSSLAPMT